MTDYQSSFVCFNTQPPEGGWVQYGMDFPIMGSFNTQPPEGGWAYRPYVAQAALVSTHSRLKAAGDTSFLYRSNTSVSTHSRLKAAGKPCVCSGRE